MFIREYNCNKLLREDAISAEELDAVFGPFERRKERRQKRRIRTKRVSSNSSGCSSLYWMQLWLQPDPVDASCNVTGSHRHQYCLIVCTVTHLAEAKPPFCVGSAAAFMFTLPNGQRLHHA